jgi:GntR family transcriptional regulator
MAAKYREIAAELRESIDNGRYGPGALLPSIDVLAGRFQVAAMTVRTALKLLESEGLVRIEHGTGTLVVDRRSVLVELSRYADVMRPGGTLGPWQTACERAGVNGNMVMIDVATATATADVAEALGIEAGAPVVRRDRHATIDDQAVQLHTAWYPLALVEGTPLTGSGRIEGGVYGAMISAGLNPQTADEKISTRIANAEEAAELRLREAANVMVLDRVTRDGDGRPLELLSIVANPARSVFIYDGLPLGI